MLTWVAVVLLAAATGTLALSVLAKVAGWQATVLSWPVRGRLRAFAGPAAVTVAESAVVAVAVAPLPARARLAVVAVLFAGYAVAALRLRGRTCGCFGSWLPARFTVWHAVSCGVFAAACLSVAVWAGTAPGPGPATAAAATGALVAAAVAAVLARSRGAAREEKIAQLPAPQLIDHVVIFTSKACGFCEALRAQRLTYEAMAGCPLELREATEPADHQAAGGSYPAAVAYDREDAAISAPVHGLDGIRDLLRHTQLTTEEHGEQTRPATGAAGQPESAKSGRTRHGLARRPAAPALQQEVLIIKAVVSLLRTRKAGTSQLLAGASRPVRRVRDHRPPITALRVAYRVLHGFGPPLAENAAIVAALRTGGWPAQVVIGAEPLPDRDGRRPVHTWIEIGGQPAGTYLATDTYLVDLARFPEIA